MAVGELLGTDGKRGGWKIIAGGVTVMLSVAAALGYALFSKVSQFHDYPMVATVAISIHGCTAASATLCSSLSEA